MCHNFSCKGLEKQLNSLQVSMRPMRKHIKDISGPTGPYTIKAKVIEKTNVCSPDGQALELQIITFQDEQGTKMKTILRNEELEEFDDSIHDDMEYDISNAKLKVALPVSGSEAPAAPNYILSGSIPITISLDDRYVIIPPYDMVKRKYQALVELDAYCVNDLPVVRRRIRDACNICLKNLDHNEEIEYDDEKDVFRANLEPNHDSRKRPRLREAENETQDQSNTRIVSPFRETSNQQNTSTESPFRDTSNQQNTSTDSPSRETSNQQNPSTDSPSRETSIPRSPPISSPHHETPIEHEASSTSPTRARARSTHSTARGRPSRTTTGSRPRQTAAGSRSVHEPRRNPNRSARPQPNQIEFVFSTRSCRMGRRGGGSSGEGRRAGGRRAGGRRAGGRRARGRRAGGRRAGEYYVIDDVVHQKVIIEQEDDSDTEEEDDDTSSGARDTGFEEGVRDTGFEEEKDASDLQLIDTNFEDEEDSSDMGWWDPGFKDEDDANDSRERPTASEDEDDDIDIGRGKRATAPESEEDGTTSSPKTDFEKSVPDIEQLRLSVGKLNVNKDYDTSILLSDLQKHGGFCLLLFDTLRALPEASCELVVTKESMEKGLSKVFGIKFDEDFYRFMKAVAIDLNSLLGNINVDVRADEAFITLTGSFWSEVDVDVGEVLRYFSNRRSELLSQSDLLFHTGMLVSSLEERYSSKYRNGKQTKSKRDSRNLISEVVLAMQDKQLASFDLGENVMGYKQTIYVSKEDMAEFLNMEELRISCIQVFIGYLHSICDKDRYGFVCPEYSSMVGHDEYESRTYIYNWMRKGQKKIYFVPYHHINHWMLAVIDVVENNQIYWLDSSRFPDPVVPCFKDLIDRSVIMYGFGRGTRQPSEMPQWIKLDCARQPGETECAYYIMRYMFEIVTNSNSMRSLNELFQDTSSYSQDKIDEVRDLWADFMVGRFVE